MTTELTFLIELLLKHKLEDGTKDAVAARIKLVEEQLTSGPSKFNIPFSAPANLPPEIARQSPSTQLAMLKHMTHVVPEPAPVTVVAQTAAAKAAVEDRERLIAGKPIHDAKTGRPRKF